jgi:transcriptional regulator with XRE-family HTH domain
LKKVYTPLTWLTKLRESKGMSILQLADAADISDAFVAMIEKGERMPRPEKAKRIGAALGLSSIESLCRFYPDSTE